MRGPQIKHDGYRFNCRRGGDRISMFSRRGHDYTERVPAIAAALKAMRVSFLTIDCEGVVRDDDGVADFDLLRAALARREALARLLRRIGHAIQLCIQQSWQCV